MSIRLNCRACRTAFLTSDDRAGRRVACPKCGVEQTVPATVAVEAPDKPVKESVFVPATATAPRPRRRWRSAALALLVVVPITAAALAVAWPTLRNWWNPPPPAPTDPAVIAGTAYLKALAADDAEAAHQRSTIADPPAIRSFQAVRRIKPRDRAVKGSFAPIAALHGRIAERFAYDPAIGRFTTKNPLGPAAETLDTLHDAKTKAEQEAIAKKIASGDPNDLFDAAEGLGKSIAQLAEGALAPKNLVPTYKQLVEDAKPRLPADQEALALNYAEDRDTWDALLHRPFPTLKADGPFILETAELKATVHDKLASSGDPPTTLVLTLTRFRLEGIDTGWKVTAARRADAPAARPEPEPKPAPPSQSESPSSK